MKSFFKIIVISFFVLAFFACGDHSSEKHKKAESKQSAAESLVKVNKYLVKSEDEEIDNYVRRHGWKMTKTGSGLRYEVYENGSGPLVQKGQVIEMEYVVSLITGDIVYSSKGKGKKGFVVGHGGVEAGLEEAVLLLRKGDKAHIILPSHLAFGLLGDQKRIPSRSTLIYDLEIVNLK
jgi:FKBP-type peptidyl-prolyl cis-trans isomerase